MDSRASLKNKKVLVTCGPTWAAIDDMRVISNKSTGSLGQMMAKKAAAAGGKVTLLEGPVKHPLETHGIKIKRFSFFEDFDALLNKTLKNKFDIIIHAAAVSDYKVKNKSRVKLPSGAKKLKLELTPTKKLINTIKRKQPKSFLVGFKLESSLSKPKIKAITEKLFKDAKCDMVVANYFHRKKYKGFVVLPGGIIASQSNSRQKVVSNIIKEIKGCI